MLAAALWALLAPSARAAQFPAVERSTSPIIVVYPAENMALPTTDGEFVMGSVSDPKGLLQINGETVAVRPNGAFLAWVPVQPGTFTFNCGLTLKDGTTATFQRSILVPSPPVPLPAKPAAIDGDSLWPKADMELRPGDWLLARMKASPGAKARFRLAKHAWQPMRESNPSLGLYEGAYLVGPGEELEAAPIEFEAGSGWSTARARTSAKVALTSAAPGVASVRGNAPALVKAGPEEGALFYAPGGTRFVAAGRVGLETKVALSGGQAGWIETKNLEFLPPGAQPPRAVTDVISTKASEEGTLIHIGLTDRVPFLIEEADDLGSLTVRLHYAVAHTNWIIYDGGDPVVDQIRFRQEAAEIVAVTIRLKPSARLWGYQASYEGSGLKIELRRAPRLAAAPASPLKGLTVFLDPGHMPSASGATGPLGTREMDVNFAVAKAVESRLLKQGAKPILSRKNKDDEVALIDRPRLAVEGKADLFVSVHNNNLPDGKNPFSRPHGYSVFYYHPHSLALAREVYHAYEKGVPLPGEDLRYGDLLVLRMTAMPAILTESAYLTFPDQEEMLLDPKFRGQLADTIVSGLRSFLEKERAEQKPRRGRRSY